MSAVYIHALAIIRFAIMSNIANHNYFATHLKITTDFWTSVAQDAYLGVTAHYISPEFKSVLRYKIYKACRYISYMSVMSVR